MPDLIIKPAAQSGNKVIIQDQAGGAVITTADSGATIANATLTSPTLNSPTLNSPTLVTPALGTPASGVLGAGVTGGSGLSINAPMFIADYDSSNGTIAATHDNFIAFANDRVVELDSTGSASTSMFSETNKRYTPDTAGYYYFVVQCALDDVSDGASVGSSLWKNGANVRDVEMRIGSSSGTKATSCSSIEYMNGSSDYIEGRVKHADGSSRVIIGGNYSIFAGYKLGT